MTPDANYRTTLEMDSTPEEVFAAIVNVRGWWSENIDGDTDRLGVFRYSYRDVHRCSIRITELIPGKRVGWHVVDNFFDFTSDKAEWTGSDIVFDVVQVGRKTQLRFTHVGLVPTDECYDVCSDAWGSYLHGSLRDLITQGKGQPNPRED